MLCCGVLFTYNKVVTQIKVALKSGHSEIQILYFVSTEAQHYIYLNNIKRGFIVIFDCN